MTDPSYTCLGALAEYWRELLSASASEAQALARLRSQIYNSQIVFEPPLPAPPYELALFHGDLMISTDHELFDAADYRAWRREASPIGEPGPEVKVQADTAPIAQATTPPTRRGRPWSSVWEETILPIIDPIVAKGGAYGTLDAAVDAVLSLMAKKDRLERRTIERWINRNRPGWVAAETRGKKRGT